MSLLTPSLGLLEAGDSVKATNSILLRGIAAYPALKQFQSREKDKGTRVRISEIARRLSNQVRHVTITGVLSKEEGRVKQAIQKLLGQEIVSGSFFRMISGLASDLNEGKIRPFSLVAERDSAVPGFTLSIKFEKNVISSDATLTVEDKEPFREFDFDSSTFHSKIEKDFAVEFQKSLTSPANKVIVLYLRLAKTE